MSCDIHEDEEALDEFTKWITEYPVFEKGFEEIVEMLQSSWNYPEYIKVTDISSRKEIIVDISTGGWSIHEEIMDALQKNFAFWALSWFSTRRGGHYVFKIPRSLWKLNKNSSSVGSSTLENTDMPK